MKLLRDQQQERKDMKNWHSTDTWGTEAESKQNPTNTQNLLTLQYFNALFNIKLPK